MKIYISRSIENKKKPIYGFESEDKSVKGFIISSYMLKSFLDSFYIKDKKAVNEKGLTIFPILYEEDEVAMQPHIRMVFADKTMKDLITEQDEFILAD
jgi:hypothetical protein